MTDVLPYRFLYQSTRISQHHVTVPYINDPLVFLLMTDECVLYSCTFVYEKMGNKMEFFMREYMQINMYNCIYKSLSTNIYKLKLTTYSKQLFETKRIANSPTHDCQIQSCKLISVLIIGIHTDPDVV